MGIENWIVNCRAREILTPDQLLALGTVTAEFGMLEAALSSHATVALKLQTTFGRITGNPGAKVHAEILRDVLPVYLEKECPEIIGPLMAALNRVSPLADRRHDLLHASWGSIHYARGVEKGRHDEETFAFLHKKRGREFKRFATTAAEILSLADEIAATRYELNQLFAQVEFAQIVAAQQKSATATPAK